MWIYIRIKLTLRHAVSKERNIREYIYDYLKTLPPASKNGVFERLNNIINKLDESGKGREELEELKFALDTLKKMQDLMARKGRY